MRRYWLAICIALFLLTYIVRVSKLSQAEMWWDEAWSVMVAQMPLHETTFWTARDSHPPVYQWALHVWVRLVGPEPFAVRYLSVLCGLLAVPLSMVAALLLAGRSRFGALAAGFVLSVLTLHVEWSQETRMYAMTAMWAALAFYGYLRLPSGGLRWWMVTVFAAAAATLSQYMGFFVVALMACHLALCSGWRPKILARFALMLLTTAVMIGAWLLYAIPLIQRSPRAVDSDLIYFAQLWLAVLVSGGSTFIEQYQWPALMMGSFVVTGCALLWRAHRRMSLLALLTIALPPIFFALINLVLDFPVTDRYYVIYLPLAAAVIGALAAVLRSRAAWVARFGLMTYVGFLLVALWRDWDARYLRDIYSSMMQAAVTIAPPDTRFVFMSGDRYPLVHYNLARLNASQTAVGINADGGGETAMQVAVGTRHPLWLLILEPDIGDRDGSRRAWLNTHYQTVFFNPVGYNGFGLYARMGEAAVWPQSSVVISPVIDEVRPGDVVRFGVPQGVQVSLYYGDQQVALHQPDRWQLVEFPFYPAYPNGLYNLRVQEQIFEVSLTHSQPPPVVSSAPMRTFGSFALHDASWSSLVPGKRMQVALLWRSEKHPDRNYSVFVHLRGGFNPATGGPVWAQSDGSPADTPATAWYPGLAAVDRHELVIPQALPPGDYTLVAGLYDSADGQPVLLPDGSAEYQLTTFQIP